MPTGTGNARYTALYASSALAGVPVRLTPTQACRARRCIKRSAVSPCKVNAIMAEPSTYKGSNGAHISKELRLWGGEEWSSNATTGWHPLNQPALWQGSNEAALREGAPTADLSPAWRMMLLSNGSVTRHLQQLTGREVTIECMEMQDIGHDAEGLPDAAALIPGPLVQRQVTMHCPKHKELGNSEPLVYAASWWPAGEVDAYLADKALPIWISLGNMELYRDIRNVCYGNSAFLEQKLGHPGPFWGRQYIFWNSGRPLTLIHEVFSPALQRFLGPISLEP